MIRFSEDVRKRHVAKTKHLDDFEKYIAEYEERIPRRFTRYDRPKRQLGNQATYLLVSALLRAWFLTETAIHCVNGGLTPGLYLAVRAHLEMTGLVSHLIILLRRFYSGEISTPEMQRTLDKLGLGRRWDSPELVEEDLLAINALTLVGSAAKLLDNKEVERGVNDCYAFLSEHCHPNLFSRLAGVHISDDLRVVELDRSLVIDESDLGTGLSHGVVSQGLFFIAFDQCFHLLEQHEQIPTFED